MDKEQIKYLVSQGRTNEAIKLALEGSDSNDLLMLSGKFVRLSRDNNMGMIEHSAYLLELSKINNALLEICKQEKMYEPFKSQKEEIPPVQPIQEINMKNSLNYFLDWWDGEFKPSSRQNQSAVILSQLSQLTDWMQHMPGFEEFLLPLQQVEAKLKNKSITSVQASESLKELVEGLLLLEQDLALEVGLKPLYDTAVSPAGTKAEVEKFLAAWKKKSPKDPAVKSNIDTAKECLETGNFEAVRLVKTKSYLKNLIINF